LSFKVLGEVVALMNVGALQLRLPPALKVPLFTATVFGADVLLKPRPA
jgi:hypothetical protein